MTAEEKYTSVQSLSHKLLLQIVCSTLQEIELKICLYVLWIRCVIPYHIVSEESTERANYLRGTTTLLREWKLDTNSQRWTSFLRSGIMLISGLLKSVIWCNVNLKLPCTSAYSLFLYSKVTNHTVFINSLSYIEKRRNNCWETTIIVK